MIYSYCALSYIYNYISLDCLSLCPHFSPSPCSVVTFVLVYDDMYDNEPNLTMKMINEGFKDYMQNGKMQCSCVIYLKGTTKQQW